MTDEARVQEYRKAISSIESRIGDARLMAVSKTRSLDEVMDAYEAGARLFGENHVQEIVEKFSVDGKPCRPGDMELHMIGHLQSNKVNKVVPLVDMIESIDSVQLLQKVDRAAENCGKVIDVLLEVNTSGEESKSGFGSEDELYGCLDASKELRNVHIRGLMTVGPVSCRPEDKDRLTADAFAYLKGLFDSIGRSGAYPHVDMDVLSMGMSGDYMIGVENGSTEVRIGTSIFGARDYGQDNGKDNTTDPSVSVGSENGDVLEKGNAKDHAMGHGDCNPPEKGASK